MKKLISGVLDFHRRLAAGRAGVYEPLAEGVLRQLSALRTYDSVAKREEGGELRLHGWWFDIRAPRVEVWSVEQQRFVSFETYFEGASS
jgi:carbonic anhydrase